MDLQKSIERLNMDCISVLPNNSCISNIEDIQTVLEALEKVKTLRDKANKEYSNIYELLNKTFEKYPNAENSYKLKEYFSVMQELGGIIQELDEIIS